MKAVLMEPKYGIDKTPQGFTARDIVRIACDQESVHVQGTIESLETEFKALRDIVAGIMTEEQMRELAGKLDNWRIVNEPKF
jgi:hypothetical protein